jgi:plastocyanin
MRALRLAAATLLLLLVGLATTANAGPLGATAAVTAQVATGFTPKVVTIGVGDSVRWTNGDAGIPHTTTSTTGVWDQQISPTATVTFSQAGTFPYACKIHASMTGTIIVQPAATPAPTPPPTVPPTPQPTIAPTPQPTLAPTAPPTVEPTPAPTASTSASPTTSAPTVAVASPTATAIAATPRATPVPANDAGPGPLIVAGAAVVVVGLGALAWFLLRR